MNMTIKRLLASLLMLLLLKVYKMTLIMCKSQQIFIIEAFKCSQKWKYL